MEEGDYISPNQLPLYQGHIVPVGSQYLINGGAVLDPILNNNSPIEQKGQLELKLDKESELFE